MNGVRVRDAVPADSEAIAELLAELGYPARASEIPPRLRGVAEEPGYVLVADEDGEVYFELEFQAGETWSVRRANGE